MVADFEFRLEDPVNMLPADELFSDGKLMPLQLPTVRPATTSVRSPETQKLRTDPKAPRSSSRWKELLRLKKLPHNCNNEDKHEAQKKWKNFLNRSSKSSNDDSSSINLPLLNKDTDCYNECISISSSRLSLSSSSSSSHEHDDLPRLSLDSDKPNVLLHSNQNSNPSNPPRIRLVKHRALSSENPIHRQPADCTATSWGLSIDDSPRMNSSGKIVFHNLGRSASSPSSFNGGGSRYKHGGSVERSYSANVRVNPILNVPVCTSLRRSSKSGVLFGFPHFSSSQQKKDCVSINKKQHHCSSSRPNRSDRIKE